MLRVLVAPRDGLDAAIAQPRASWRIATLFALVTVLGALTLPRQLPTLLTALVGPGGPPHGAFMLDGLRRLIVLDRVVPPLTPAIAGALLYVLAGAWLGDAPSRRRALVAVIALGLTPLVVLRLGELITVWLVPAAGLTAGEVVALPRWFATGPVAFVAPDAVTPALDLLDARVNIITAWIVTLWALGMRRLDDEWGAWQVGAPVLAFTLASALTWWLGMPTMALILGRP